MRKLWGGAFLEGSDQLVDRFGQSIETDLRIWEEDVLGSIAHARMLGKTGILTEAESEKLVKGLEQIIDGGPKKLPTDVEDIHTAVEIRLAELVGPVAGKLHTARSRNDQVATDTRLFLRRELENVCDQIKSLQDLLLDRARTHKADIMPGYTHQQPAQPITLGFWLLAHFWALQRNGWRAERLWEFVNYSPLGSAALAGTGFPIDRESTAADLGFKAPIPNALDATSDRSFVLDALHICALTMIDLSRLAQELITFTTGHFGFLTLPDSVTTGSSIMPQKRNPDMAELIRGRSGRAIGNYTGFAATMKALPLGYNRDTQDDKPPLFESMGFVEDSLKLMELMLSGADWKVKRMETWAGDGFSCATDLADFLTTQGMAFREAHETIGKLVRAWPKRDGEFLAELLGPELGAKLGKELEELLSPSGSVRRRDSEGGPGPKAMAIQIRRAAKLLRKNGFAEPY
jgi:argininosuccinate lyase